MVNGMAVLGWGVAVSKRKRVLGASRSRLLIPEVYRLRAVRCIDGRPPRDRFCVLKVVEMLRKKGVVSKFDRILRRVALYAAIGRPLPLLPTWPPIRRDLWLSSRSIAETLRLHADNRPRRRPDFALVEHMTRKNGMWRDEGIAPIYTGTRCRWIWARSYCDFRPETPQDYIALTSAHPPAFAEYVKRRAARGGQDTFCHNFGNPLEARGGQPEPSDIPGRRLTTNAVMSDRGLATISLHDGSIVIAIDHIPLYQHPNPM